MNKNIKKYLPSKMSLKQMLILIKKELFNFFATPLAYIILSLFVGVLAILFFGVGKFLQVGTADLSILFGYISFTFVIIIPALTMGSISREKQSGTIEYLLTQPITEIQLLISKFISYLVFILILLLSTLPLVIMIRLNGALDIGQVILQYIGAFILGACLVSLGIAVSSFLSSEIAAFIVTLVLAASLILIGSDLIQIRFGLDFIIEKIGLLSHYQSISRGVLDTRDVLYFIAFVLAFLSISYYFLIKDKFPPKAKSLQYARGSLAILILLTILIGYIGQLIPGRIDFTSNRIYTLSEASTNVINNVDDILNIKLYASNNLPIEFQSQIRNVQDLLRDYQTYSSGKINYEFIQPSSTTDGDNEASKAGLQPIQFQVNSADSSQLVVGYFGIALNYLDRSEILDLNDQSILNSLEYNLTKKINKLSNKNLKVIGFASDGVSYSLGSQNLQTIESELRELFTVKDVDLSGEIPAEVTTLVIAGPNSEISTEIQTKIKDYYLSGGSVFFLTNPVTVDPQTFTGINNENSLKDLFVEQGVTISQNLVYDLESNNLVDAGYVFPINYPLWITAQSTNSNISILKDVEQVSYLWGSSISIDSSKLGDTKVFELLRTSETSNIQVNGGYNLAPDQNWSSKENDASYLLALALENSNGGKLVVSGDSKLFSDDYGLISLNENLAFALGSLEWLSGSDSIASIQAKVRSAPRITLTSEQATILSVVGVGLPVVTIIIVGVTRFYLRKRKQKKKFKL